MKYLNYYEHVSTVEEHAKTAFSYRAILIGNSLHPHGRQDNLLISCTEKVNDTT